MESDAPDMAPPPEFVSHPLPNGSNHPANLPAIATETASRLGLAPTELENLTNINFSRWLGR